MGIINDARPGMTDLPAEAQSWAAGASADKKSAEGSQDAARHAEWTGSMRSLIEEATKKGLMTEEIRRWMGESPAEAAEYLARGLGMLGSMTIGAGGEAIGMGRALLQAGGAAVRGDFGKAGGIISDAYKSGKMDLHNNMAGAMEYGAIKDPEARRAAILKAAENAELQPDARVSPSGAAVGTLVRRR